MNAIKIAIAEEHLLFRQLICLELKRHNFIISEQVNNGQELLNLLKKLQPDIILLGIEMPVLSGKETLLRIKAEYPNIKVIILTQFEEIELIANFFASGARGYLTKNTAVDVVIDAINTVYATGFYFANNPKLFQNAITTGKKIKFPKAKFSPREVEIIPLLCDGLRTKEIARLLSIEEKSVQYHRDNLIKKAGVGSIAEFIVIAIKRGYNHLFELRRKIQ